MNYFKTILLTVILLYPLLSKAQKTYKVVNFPGPYYGEIVLSDTTKNNGVVGWVAVYDSLTDKELAKSQAAYFNSYEWMKTDADRSDYRKQHFIIYDDFSFDGIKDLALYNGPNGLRGQATYDIFLGNDNGFAYSPGFSKIIEDTGVLFKIDSIHHCLITSATGGNSTFFYRADEITNNRPAKLLDLWGNMVKGYVHYKGQVRENGAMTEKDFMLFGNNAYKILNVVLSFEVENNKLMQLIVQGDSLVYFFRGKPNLEGAYLSVPEKPELIYASNFQKNNEDGVESLSFSRNGVTYIIYNHKIEIKTGEGTFVKQAKNLKSHLGSLEKLGSLQLKNVRTTTDSAKNKCRKKTSQLFQEAKKKEELSHSQLNDDQVQNITKLISFFQTHQTDSIVAHITYPLTREYPLPNIQNATEMETRFSVVFDSSLIKKIATSKLFEWSPVGWRGVMLDNGIVWTDGYEGNIISINHQSKSAQKVRQRLLNKDRKHLYPALKNYKRPILKIKSTHYLIRIDELANGKYRYISWKSGEKESKKPNLVLTNGTIDYDGSGGNHYFQFINGNIIYIIYRHIIGTEHSPDVTLVVKKEGKEILNEAGSLLEIDGKTLRYPKK